MPVTGGGVAAYEVYSERSSRAASTIAVTFRSARSALFTGRFENVPKPQSGFKNNLSGAYRSSARCAARRMSAVVSIALLRGLTTPSPSSFPGNSSR